MKSGVISSRVILAGAIAGFVSGIAAFLAVHTGEQLGIYHLGFPFTIEFMLIQLPGQLAYNTVWGIIFGIMFVIVYDCIPGKGIWKGLFFGMIYFFLSSNVRPSFIMAAWAYIDMAIDWVWVGFFCAAAWGLVMGTLYKKE